MTVIVIVVIVIVIVVIVIVVIVVICNAQQLTEIFKQHQTIKNKKQWKKSNKQPVTVVQTFPSTVAMHKTV